MKKVLIFSLAYFPKHVGGAEIAIKEKTDRMPGIEFHMICLGYDSSLPRTETIGNVHVHRIGFTRKDPSMADLRHFPLHLNKFWYQSAAVWAALALHRKHHFDATWAMMAHSCGVPAALFKLFNPRIPFILELQEGDPPEQVERLALPVWPLFVRAFTSADVISVISTFLGQWAKRRGARGEVVLVPNAVDYVHFSRPVERSALTEVRNKLDKKMGDVFLITTSRLVIKNAVDDVIRALVDLPNNVRFIVLGTGPEEAKLRRLAADSGVAERVTFVGYVGHTDMPVYLQASDIFVRASRSEGMGNSFLEAMAAGLPVIATQEGGIADFLFDVKRDPDKVTTGWAVDKDSPLQIAAAVRRVVEDPEHAKTVARDAQEMVRERYDWNIIARKMQNEVFGKVLDG